MSVNSYIEVLNLSKDSQVDENLFIEWNYGILWSYQIAVAGGRRDFQGVDDNPSITFSIYNQRISQSLQNYQTAIHACLLAAEFGIPKQADWLHHKLEELFIAQDWYQKAWLKLPDGIVRLDWWDRVRGLQTTKALKEWDEPNEIFAFYVQLAKDCTKVKTEKLSIKDFAKKYRKYSGERGGASEMEIEL
jgi:hypothetical protein